MLNEVVASGIHLSGHVTDDCDSVVRLYMRCAPIFSYYVVHYRCYREIVFVFLGTITYVI